MKNKIAIFLLSTVIFKANVFAENSNNNPQSSQTETGGGEFQKVVDAYKAYLAETSVKTRDEIIAYRKEIAKLNRLKREEYQKLSQDAQGFLAKEQEFKKKLPFKQRKFINSINPGEISSDNAKSQ